MSRPYSEEEKKRIISLYKLGYGCTSIANQLNFNEGNVSRIINRYLQYGKSGLERLPIKRFTAEFRYKVVQYLLNNKLSLERTALKFNISQSAVNSWLSKYNKGGYALLGEDIPKGRKPNIMGRPRKKEPQTELEKLRYENEFLRTENALLKKVKALVEEKEARLRKIGQKPSKN